MKYLTYFIKLGFALLVLFSCSKMPEESAYPLEAISFEKVSLEDDFWSERINTNREVTIPFSLEKISETGRMDNFLRASGKIEGEHEGKRYNDSDVYKVIEGIGYSLMVYPDEELEKYTDSLINEIAAAQEKDGYLFTGRTSNPDNPPEGSGAERWSQMNSSHELYNVGHLYEAAVAYYKATKKRTLLNVAYKNADFLLETFGHDKLKGIPGHQEIELALVKLYDISGKKEYLNLAKFFLDQRGLGFASPPFPDSSPFNIYDDPVYLQDHLPVIDQNEACGHAVRATYMYTGMADVAALTGQLEYQQAISTIWNDVIGFKTYLTGGVGSRHTTEAFGDKYELPNKEAYTETCASIGNIFWNFRMYLNSGSSMYHDMVEKILYNGMLSGVSLSGDRFFYQNPLESDGGYTRSPWFEVSCCPGNLSRFLPSVPGYIYAKEDSVLFINQFISSSTQMDMMNSKVDISMESEFPWEGKVKINIAPKNKSDFAVKVRIPGWFQGFAHPSSLYTYEWCSSTEHSVKLNGEEIDYEEDDGYMLFSRKWDLENTIEIEWEMGAKLVRSHVGLVENQNKLALQRGPIIYCIEEADNPDIDFESIRIDTNNEIQYVFEPELLGGVGTLIVSGTQYGMPVELIAIPYYAWSNRDDGKMKVWIDVDPMIRP